MSIRAENLNYIYGKGTAFEQYALKDINFEIQDGEFVGIIGHTGSGKIHTDSAFKWIDQGDQWQDLL